MRYFLLIFIVSFVTFVNAVHTNKRELSFNVKECINELTTTQSKLWQLGASASIFLLPHVESFDPTTLIAFPDIRAKEADLKICLESAKIKCMRIVFLSHEEAFFLMESFQRLAPVVLNTLNMIIDKRTQFGSFDFVLNNIKGHILYMYSCFDVLTHLKMSYPPPDLSNGIQEAINQINDSINRTLKAYSLLQ